MASDGCEHLGSVSTLLCADKLHIQEQIRIERILHLDGTDKVIQSNCHGHLLFLPPVYTRRSTYIYK